MSPNGGAPPQGGGMDDATRAAIARSGMSPQDFSNSLVQQGGQALPGMQPYTPPQTPRGAELQTLMGQMFGGGAAGLQPGGAPVGSPGGPAAGSQPAGRYMGPAGGPPQGSAQQGPFVAGAPGNSLGAAPGLNPAQIQQQLAQRRGMAGGPPMQGGPGGPPPGAGMQGMPPGGPPQGMPPGGGGQMGPMQGGPQANPQQMAQLAAMMQARGAAPPTGMARGGRVKGGFKAGPAENVPEPKKKVAAVKRRAPPPPPVEEAPDVPPPAAAAPMGAPPGLKKGGKLKRAAKKPIRKNKGGACEKMAAGGAMKVRRGFPNVKAAPKKYAAGGKIRGCGAATKGTRFQGIF